MPPRERTWDRIDLPVLRFVQTFPYNVTWQFDRTGPTEELPQFGGEELDEALRRLEDYGLIRGRRHEPFAASLAG